MAELVAQLQYLANGRRHFAKARFDNMPVGAILERAQIMVDGMVLVNIPFAMNQYVSDDELDDD